MSSLTVDSFIISSPTVNLIVDLFFIFNTTVESFFISNLTFDYSLKLNPTVAPPSSLARLRSISLSPVRLLTSFSSLTRPLTPPASLSRLWLLHQRSDSWLLLHLRLLLYLYLTSLLTPTSSQPDHRLPHHSFPASILTLYYSLPPCLSLLQYTLSTISILTRLCTNNLLPFPLGGGRILCKCAHYTQSVLDILYPSKREYIFSVPLHFDF